MAYNPNNLPDNPSIIPRGNNSLRALFSYLESFIYEVSYPEGELFAANPIDLRKGSKFLYGRVDVHGFCVMPHPKKMKQIRSEQVHNALDFVTDNFERMVRFHSKLKSKGKLALPSSFEFMKPAKSWKDQDSVYEKYLETFYESFVKTVLSTESDKKIIDYNSFEKTLLSFCKRLTNVSLPITRTSFVRDFHGSPVTSGLSIELDNKNHSDDFVKYSEFIRDPNFETYRAITERFGFVIDKNSPWRIICDLKSPFIVDQMKKKGVNNLQAIFDNYFVRTNQIELENVKSIFINFYNRFATENPDYEKKTPCGSEFFLRRPLSKSEAEKRFSDSHWIRLLAYLRALETERTWTQHKFDKVVSEATKIYKFRDRNQALDRLESYFMDNQEKYLQNGLTRQDKFGRILGKSNKSIQKFRF